MQIIDIYCDIISLKGCMRVCLCVNGVSWFETSFGTTAVDPKSEHDMYSCSTLFVTIQ